MTIHYLALPSAHGDAVLIAYEPETGRCARLIDRMDSAEWFPLPTPDFRKLFPPREGKLTMTIDKAPYLGRDVCSACGDIPDDVSPTQHMRNVHGLEPGEFDIS